MMPSPAITCAARAPSRLITASRAVPKATWASADMVSSFDLSSESSSWKWRCAAVALIRTVL